MDDVRTDDRESRVDKVTLRKSLGDRLIGHRLLYFLTLTSTNDHARELAEDGWPEGTVVLAEEQTAGKGRAGRSWHSPPGIGLYFSIVLRPAIPPEGIPLLTLMAAVGAARGLRDNGFEGLIKWPNDLLLTGRKVGGILAESRIRPQGPPEVIVGLGLNVNHRDEDIPSELRGRAGSLRLQSGAPADRTAILTSLLIRLDEAYASFRETGEQEMLDAFLALCPMAQGRAVQVSGSGEAVSGQTAGLTATGALRVATASGLREVHVGDLSVAETPDAARG